MSSTGWFTRRTVGTGDSRSPDISSSHRLGDSTIPRQYTRLPSGPASAIGPGWQIAVGCLPPPWACRRLSSQPRTTLSGHRRLPRPFGNYPAHLGPPRQATGGSHGLSATIQPTWDHPVRPPRALPSSHCLPYHP
ncbi:hypothetical protein PCANC_10856 [Puccinia coronata f. sp. avenae]|uniref:Uncharacterized protein n=1 Tax=Puccinia coronata f. sp. avenae TaxID=200324 RepID=A0A2N5V116_9BASI|nr:hypothetical protein PCANC_10856 [Puccinia coronata f. sp. avenae]